MRIVLELIFSYFPGMNTPPVIEHDPNEPKKPYRPVSWLLIWPLVAFGWWGLLSTRSVDLITVIGAMGTGALLATWAIEITGNKVPDSWRSKSANRNGNRDF
jgi:hypothetical protein